MKLPEAFDFNQSNLQDYVDCPYRFYLRHILRTRWPALVVDDAIEFERRGQTGARFHRMIQQFLLGVPEDRLTAAAAVDPEPEVLTWWEGFLENVPPWLDGMPHVEITLGTFLDGKRLVAKYDLILAKPDGSLEIFDWKTSQRAMKKAWLLEKVQTRLYRLILARAAQSLTEGKPIRPENIRMSYWFAPYPDTPVTLPYTTEACRDDQAYFEDLIREIGQKSAEGFFRTQDLRQCRFCVYRSHCDRGIEAGDLADFEMADYEPETTNLDVDFESITEIQF